MTSDTFKVVLDLETETEPQGFAWQNGRLIVDQEVF